MICVYLIANNKIMATKTNTSIGKYNYFRITRTIGHKYVDGVKVPIKKQFMGSSKGDAEARYKAYLQEQAEAKYNKQVEMDTATLHDRAEQFIKDSLEPSSKYAEASKHRYKTAYYTHVENTWLDQMRIKDIRPSDIQKFYNELDVSKATILSVNRFMSAFYKWMVKNEYSSNLMTAVDIPVKKDTRRHEGIVIWDDKTWERLTSEYFDFRHDFLIKLLCYSGMRISECLALRYGDIRDNTIHLTRQLYEGETKSPKYNSKREIPMHPKLIEAFEIHKAWHQEEMLKNEYETDYIFTTMHGTLYDVRDLRRAFARFYKRKGIEQKGFHVYRATFCTKLCEAGAPLEVASKILGHKSMEVTAKHYALVRTESKRDAIALLK